MLMLRTNLLAILLMALITITSAQQYTISSPNKSIQLTIHFADFLAFDVDFHDKTIIKGSRISMEVDGEQPIGLSPSFKKKTERSIQQQLYPLVPTKTSSILDEYNEVKLEFNRNYYLIFRAYNDGVAYRFGTTFKEEVIIKKEIFHLAFDKETSAHFPGEQSLISHYERYYLPTRLDTLDPEKFCSLPVLMTTNNIRILLTEADVYDYPCMFMKGSNGWALDSKFPKAVMSATPQPGRGDRNQVISNEAFIAKTTGTRDFPWRVMIITDEDATLFESNLVYQLSSSNRLQNTDWIQAGKVAWDWYNANNIYGVDFKAGINTETYKYYIDFASEFGLEYIILDEGWSQTTLNISESISEIDIEELVHYGNEKNVGIILWVLWGPLDADLEVLETYKNWGVKGIKVDFMQRADQYMVNFYERVAKKAAENYLIVDFHGSFKPTGLRRAYPNVLTYEGVKGNENNKWSQGITPNHNLTLPFTRMVAGPMDYTPGAMRNANPNNHYKSWLRPMSIGTRCHQVAMYVIFESPLQMLCDSPSNYLKEKESTGFIAQIPTTWEETKVLEAKLGEYVLVARKNSGKWYIAAMTNDEREFEVDFSFLPIGKYTLRFMQDGKNADRFAEDHTFANEEITPDNRLNIRLSQGGGWVGIITPVEE